MIWTVCKNASGAAQLIACTVSHLVGGCQPGNTSSCFNSRAAGCPCTQAAVWRCRATEEGPCQQGDGAPSDCIHQGDPHRPLSPIHQTLHIAGHPQLCFSGMACTAQWAVQSEFWPGYMIAVVSICRAQEREHSPPKDMYYLCLWQFSYR